MTVKVLHVFSPDYKTRFGGQTFTWKYNFSNWNDPNVAHYVFDFEKHFIDDARDAINFEYPSIQKQASRWERTKWVFSLLSTLIRHEGDYDILHIHILLWGGLFVGSWAKWRKKPAMYESILLDSDTPGGILPEKFGRLKIRLLKSYKAILAISEYLAKDYRKFGFSANQVFTLVNSVDEKIFYPVKTAEEKRLLRKRINLPSDAIALVFVGSVIERKGLDVLIRAFIESSSKRSDLYLLIVGPKNGNEQPSLDEGFVNNLYLLVNQNNLSERVTFMGLIQDRQELAEIYRASDIFVFPSRKEGLGNVILEAMACGLPVLVSQLPVLDKIIKHRDNGIVVPIDDVDALSESILMLSGDLPLAGKIGHNAHTYVAKNFGFSSWQAQLVKIYNALLS